MRGDDVLIAVQALIGLDQRELAQRAAAQLPDDLAVADLLRAADGAQQLARELAALRRDAPDPPVEGASGPGDTTGYDPHDVRSLYS